MSSFRAKTIVGFALASLFLVATGGLAVGCGSSASSLCNDICDCVGCSDEDLDECIDTIEDNEKRADDEGCSDQYADYFDCSVDQFECRKGEVDIDGCDKESELFFKCMGGKGGDGD